MKLERCGVCDFQGHHDGCGCSGIGRAQAPMLVFAAGVLRGDMSLTELHTGVMRPARLSTRFLCAPVAAGATFVSFARFPQRRPAPAALASHVEVAHGLLRRGQLTSAVSAFRAALGAQCRATGDAHPAALVIELGLLRALTAEALAPAFGREAAAQAATRRADVRRQCQRSRGRFERAFGNGKHSHTRTLDKLERSLTRGVR